MKIVAGSWKINQLQIILKVVERCNLTCHYCYYFYSGDESYKDRPPLINQLTIENLVSFVNQAVTDFELDQVHIVFHGGEPTMLPIKRFSKFCDTLSNGINSNVETKFSIQTNGTLIDEDWISIFEQYGIAVGISIDGLAERHDLIRVDTHGNPSFDKVLNTLDAIKSLSPSQLAPGVGLINVVSSDQNFEDFIKFFHNQYGVKFLSFLLPDCDHDSGLPETENYESIGQALCEIFDAAVVREDVEVRLVDEILDFFQRRIYKKSYREGAIDNPLRKKVLENQIVVVHSNGDLALDDTFMPASNWYKYQEKLNISTSSLGDFLKLPVFSKIHKAIQKKPEACLDCEWMPCCGGGAMENRFNLDNEFNNPSVYCESLKIFYEHVARFLIVNGYPENIMVDLLPGLDTEKLLDNEVVEVEL